MDLTALTTWLNGFAGFDLSDSESCDLLNHARREAARRTKYPRKVEDIGPTVAGQAAYDWPTDLLIPLSVVVAGEPWEPSDRETVRQYEKGDLVLGPQGVWYEGVDSSGTRKLYLYPTPSGGDTLEVEWVYLAPALSVDQPAVGPDEFPEWWHPKLSYFVGEIYYETVEDNPELAEVQKAKADLAVGDLIRYDNERQSGNGIAVVGIAGVTA